MERLKRALILLMLFSIFSHATMYENAEDGLTDNWRIIDNTPVASISNVESNGSKVISLNGEGRKNLFILGGKNDESQKWDNQGESKTLKWKMKFDSRYYVYIYLETSSGAVQRIRYSSSLDHEINHSELRISLGRESDDGVWVEVNRDLEADLKTLLPNDTIIAVNGFMVQGSGMVDDIAYGETNDDDGGGDDNNGNSDSTIYEDGEAVDDWSLYPNGQITNELISQNGVVAFQNRGKYILGGTNHTNGWGNETQKNISWSMKFDRRYYIYVYVTTSSGEIDFIRYSSSSDHEINHTHIRMPLGRESDDGAWIDISRDLNDDLHTLKPNDNIVEVHGIMVYATSDAGMIDDIVLSGEEDSNNDTDTIKPVITLVGNPTVNLTVGDAYTDADATARDDQDGDITANIITVDPVDTSIVGTYVVSYDVNDSANNQADQITRTVNVSLAPDTVKPVITLVGNTTVNLTVGDTYSDAGATANDDRDGNITNNIVTVNPVDTSIAGTYIITYDVNDSANNQANQVTRTVNISLAPDTVKPVITLIGDATINLTVGDSYSDAGATANDDRDGNITANIVTVDPVDTSIAGTYMITYDVNDSAGNSANTVSRTITVNEHNILSVEETLVPANCKGHITKSGKDLNNNGVLDEEEVTSTEEVYDKGTPITRNALITMIGNSENVTQVNTCKITDMSHLFDPTIYSEDQNETVTNFNQNISAWNTGSVTTMANMFSGRLLDRLNNYSLKLFNQPIESWDVSKVTDMSNIFAGCKDFNQALNDWDVSNVTTMWNMFGQSNFNHPIADWNVSNVTKMNEMFSLSPFNQDISGWDVSKVTNMANVFFLNQSFNQPLDNWDVSNVTDMSYMFAGAKQFNQALDNWHTSKVISMVGMFEKYHNNDVVFNQPLNSWDISSVTNTRFMFHANKVFNQPLNNWDTSNITNMRNMFWDTEAFNQPLDNWDTSNVINMAGMFSETPFNQDISNWDVSSVTDMNNMFLGSEVFNQNIGSWNITNVTTMEGMFDGSNLSTENYDALLQGWSIQEVQHHVKFGAGEIKYSENAQGEREILTNDFEWEIDDGGIVNNETCDTETAITLEMLKEKIINGEDVTQVNTCAITNMVGLFWSWKYNDLTEEQSSNLKNFNQDISGWNVSNVTDMYGMFEGAEAFNQPIGNWNVSKVTRMAAMFYKATVFNQPIGDWNVSNVSDMNCMFYEAKSFNQPIDDWDVSNIYNMNSMFTSAEAFNQPIGTWNVSNIGDMSYMFEGTKSFNQYIGNWNVSNATSMYGMFNEAEVFNQDISNWNISNVSNYCNFAQNPPLESNYFPNTFYEALQDTTPPAITLIGDETITLTVGDQFVDPGATAIDNIDGDITDKIESASEEVDTTNVGIYMVYYYIEDKVCNINSVERTVVVEEGN